MDRVIGANNDINKLKDEIEEVNRREQTSAGLKVNDRRIESASSSGPNNDAKAAQKEEEIRRLEVEKMNREDGLDEEEKFDREVKKREDVVREDRHGEALRENADRDKAKYEKDFAEAKEMNKEYDEEHTGEKDAKKLEQLKKEIEQARKKYAKSDYDEDKKNRWFKKIFSKRLVAVSVDTNREDCADYKTKLKEFSDYEIGKMKDGNLSDEELKSKIEELMKYFDTDEKTNLYEARTNARTEDWEGKMGGEIMKKAGDFVNWYREAGKTRKGMVGKAALSMGLTAVGLGVVAMGMRAVGGAAAGVGVTAALEARYRHKEKNSTDKKRKETMAQLESEEAEKKFNSLMEKLNTEMGSYDENLKKEKKEGLKRRMIGLGVGVFIGSGAMGELLKGSAHMIGDTDTFKSVSGYVVNSEIAKTTISFWKDKLENFLGAEKVLVGNLKEGAAHFFGPQEAMAAEIPTEEFPFNDAGIRKIAENPLFSHREMPVLSAIKNDISVPASEASIVPSSEIHNSSSLDEAIKTAEIQNPEVGKIDLDIKGGESVQGKIIENLKSTGMNDQDAGAKAFLMYEKFIEGTERSYDKVYPGTHMELGPDGEGGLKILKISEADKLGHIHHDAVTEKPETTKEAPVAQAEKPEAVKEAPTAQAEKPEVVTESPAANTEPENHSIEDQAAQAKAAAAVEQAEQEEKTQIQLLEKIQHMKESLANNHSPEAEALRAQVAQAEKLAQEKLAEAHQLRSVLEQEMAANQEIHNIYGYNEFSDHIYTSVKELTVAREEILSAYKGEIQGDGDIDKVLKVLEGKGNLSGSEQQQLTMLQNYKKSFGAAYGNMVKSFFGLKDGISDATLDLNANQYLLEHKQSRAAKIFEGLIKTMTPKEIAEISPHPQPNEKVIDWSGRIIAILWKKKADSIQ